MKCKHYWSVQYILKKEINKDGTITETRTVRKTYPQAWHDYDMANTQQKDLFMKLLNGLCAGPSSSPLLLLRLRLLIIRGHDGLVALGLGIPLKAALRRRVLRGGLGFRTENVVRVSRKIVGFID